MKLTHEEFVRAWQSATSFGEFMATTQLTQGQASSRAGYLRRRGIMLKKFTPIGPKALDIKRLNEICAETKPNEEAK